VDTVVPAAHALAALKSDGSAVSWGFTTHGGSSAAAVPGGSLSSGVSRITGNNSAFAALKSDGSVVTWGVAGEGGDSTLANGTATAAPAGALASGVDFIASPFWRASPTWAPAASTDASLASLVLHAGASAVPLSPAFSGSTTAYTANVDATTVTATATSTGTGADTTVNGTATARGVASAPIGLAVGTSTITVVVTAEDATTTRTYTVAVTRTAAPGGGQSGGDSGTGTGAGADGGSTAGPTDAGAGPSAGARTPTLIVASTSRRGRVVTTRVTVGSTGTLRQTGTLAGRRTAVACTATGTAKAAGTVTLRCRLKGAALRTRNGTLTLTTVFTPTGGQPVTETATLRLGRAR
jgi:hypothetical protein